MVKKIIIKIPKLDELKSINIEHNRLSEDEEIYLINHKSLSKIRDKSNQKKLIKDMRNVKIAVTIKDL